MKLSELVKELQYLEGEYGGDTMVELQEKNTDLYESFFVIPEPVSNMGEERIYTSIRLRSWPY